ncbi:hypothetical protein BW14_05995 [Bifidobacterium sp. UTBIF-68]|uniref:hypothetical protein n=1 Tax=Bifidobacterium sp. UTBIF-68 TaxID=1465262 RepID=UPI00112BFEB0|nr:hypothetical protein [Bifidobacterium sp. UTBIF-68]TPF93225.1 hypothetical protein BW14_05995 [Bifidobacterium sp. UTBIF-68]
MEQHWSSLPKRTWYCPNCGRQMTAQLKKDNATGNASWIIGCRDPEHFHTHGYLNAAIAEIQLMKLLNQ